MDRVLLGFSAAPLAAAIVVARELYPGWRCRALIDINSSGRKR
jgi:hypothetical protein